MLKLLKPIAGAAVLIVALLGFVAGLVIQRAPQVPRAVVPQAEDVRAAVQFAGMAQGLLQAPEPVAVVVPGDWLEAVHRLVGHAKNNLGMDAVIDPRGATFRVSKRMMAHAWLNFAVRLDQARDGGVPRLSLRAGPWRVPDRVTAVLLRFGLPLLKDDGPPPAGLKDIVSHFRVTGDGLTMNARLPKPLVGGLQAVLSPGPGTVLDMSRARGYYGDLLGYALRNSETRYPQLIRHVAEQVHDRDDLKAAVVALTMFVDGPRVRRLGGERTATPPCVLPPQPAYLHGRDDLPKHWTISAALALFLNQRTARAIGLWKEMDDSLPGGDGLAAGSGFSFVDLGADTGGVALGMVARDGAGFDAALRALRLGRDDVVLPGPVLRLPEGVPLRAFKRRYRGLEQPPMLAAEARIRMLLRQSPLYAGLPNGAY